MASRCPCGTGQGYDACCARLHRGLIDADTPDVLVRARFSAFALGEIGYLLRTLHADHEDRARREVDVLRELREAARRYRYMRLDVREVTPEDDEGTARVLFFAHVFDAGRDVGFAELSDFRREDRGFRYVGGRPVPRATATIEEALGAPPPSSAG